MALGFVIYSITGIGVLSSIRLQAIIILSCPNTSCVPCVSIASLASSSSSLFLIQCCVQPVEKPHITFLPILGESPLVVEILPADSHLGDGVVSIPLLLDIHHKVQLVLPMAPSLSIAVVIPEVGTLESLMVVQGFLNLAQNASQSHINCR